MTTITKFGTGSTEYDFTASGVYVTSYSDNFGDVVPRTTRLPGMDGGYDEFGSLRAPSEIGKVTVGLTLASNTRSGMDALRRDLREMVGWGVQRLFRSVDYQVDEQWCYARLNSAQISLNESRHTDLFQPAQVVFQVADPAWYGEGAGDGGWTWGDGSLWGSAVWGSASSTSISASGGQTDSTESIGGNLPTFPRITIVPGTGNSCQNPIIQRLIGSTVVDEVSYTGTLSGSDSLVIDCRALAVTLNGANAYANFDYQNGGWFELQAGSNSIRVNFENVGDAATVTIEYFTRWA